MYDIVVVGSINADLVFICENRPARGETILGKNFMTIPGGKGANQAVAASRLGGQVAMIGLVGHDVYGEAMVKNLSENGVDTGAVSATDAPTGVAGIIVDDHDNEIVVISGANGELKPACIDQHMDKLLAAQIVVLQLEIPIETVIYISEICSRNHIKTILNPAPARALPAALIDKVTYLTPNEHELALIFGDEPLEILLHRYPNKLIVTLGDQGAAFSDGDQIQNIGVNQVDVRDTTGAGDTFNGALASRIAAGDALGAAVRYANRAAALSITKYGAQGGMPYADEVEGWRQSD